MGKVRCSIQRIDIPAIVAAFIGPCSLFTEEVVIGKLCSKRSVMSFS